MRKAIRAYTLIELLIVAAILAALTAVLAPVFISVKSSAQKSVCFSHFKQASQGTMLYVGDYDDVFMPICYRPGAPASSRNDRTWVQLLLPYAPSFSIFVCPSDTSRRANDDATFDEDLVPGDLYSEYYHASKHTNLGFNYMVLSPVVREGREWRPKPMTTTSVANPSNTLMYVDSVWTVSDHAQPEEGGDWLVEPPCRYGTARNGQRRDYLAAWSMDFDNIYAATNGWSLGEGSEFGGAWAWHFGRINIAHVDGSASSYPLSQLEQGCHVAANWQGDIIDNSSTGWFNGGGNGSN